MREVFQSLNYLQRGKCIQTYCKHTIWEVPPVVGSSTISKITRGSTKEEDAWVGEKLDADGRSSFLSATASSLEIVSNSSVGSVFKT